MTTPRGWEHARQTGERHPSNMPCPLQLPTADVGFYATQLKYLQHARYANMVLSRVPHAHSAHSTRTLVVKTAQPWTAKWMHRKLATNVHLQEMQIHDGPLCSLCDKNPETNIHLMCECDDMHTRKSRNTLTRGMSALVDKHGHANTPIIKYDWKKREKAHQETTAHNKHLTNRNTNRKRREERHLNTKI